MAFLIPDPALARVRCTVTHLDADPLGVRLIESPTSALVLAAAPWARLPALITGLDGLRIAAYILGGAAYPEDRFLRVYIGETGSLRERMLRHARDPRKGFTSTVFVMTSRDPNFGKSDAEALQFLLDRNAESADRCLIVRGMPPVPPEIDGAAWARAEAWIEQARYLLAAAGCLLLEPRIPLEATDRSQSPPTDMPTTKHANGVSSVEHSHSSAREPELSPDVASRTYVLDRRGLWAVAVEADGRVVIRAGSEVARKAIASCDPSTRRRREALEQEDVLGEHPGRSDIWRLLRDVPISSLTGAARVVTGSHVGGRAWRLMSPLVPAA